VSDLASRLKARDRAACGTAEHGKQGLHQSYGAGYPDAVDDRHFPIFVSFRVEKARHHHHASGDKSENHDKIEAVLERTDETVQGTRSVRKSGILTCTGQQGDKQSFSPVADDIPLPGRKSLLHYITFLFLVSVFGKDKLLLFFVLSTDGV
jgi:hypothetical protein